MSVLHPGPACPCASQAACAGQLPQLQARFLVIASGHPAFDGATLVLPATGGHAARQDRPKALAAVVRQGEAELRNAGVRQVLLSMALVSETPVLRLRLGLVSTQLRKFGRALSRMVLETPVHICTEGSQQHFD
mmetsp:Transcript_85525/g.228781  ORF Transcript_85525/g.228781 Transcript_85525/m.228781 type:complete len:134 (+) Transcript_85525:2187-2588(+)